MTRRATCEPLVESIFPLFIRMSFSRRWFFNVVSLHKNLIRFSFVRLRFRFHLIIIYELCMKSNIHLNVTHSHSGIGVIKEFIFFFVFSFPVCCILCVFVQQFSLHRIFFFLLSESTNVRRAKKKMGKSGK